MWHSPVSLATIMSGLLCSSLRLLCTQKSHSIFVLSFTSFFWCVFIPFGSGWKSIFLYITQWTSTPTLSHCHSWNCFWVSILHATTTWLIVSSLSPLNLLRSKTLYVVCSQCLVLYSHQHILFSSSVFLPLASSIFLAPPLICFPHKLQMQWLFHEVFISHLYNFFLHLSTS